MRNKSMYQVLLLVVAILLLAVAVSVYVYYSGKLDAIEQDIQEVKKY